MLSNSSFRSFLLLLLFCVAVLAPGCDLLGEEDGEDGLPAVQDVIVGNGGSGVGAGNGSLTFYDPDTEETSTLDLEGFVISLTEREDRLYAVLNTSFTSGALGVVDLDGPALTRIETAGGRPLGALRNLAFTPGGGDLYATDFNGGGQVTGFSLENGSASALDDTVATAVAYPAGVAAAAGKVFAADYGSGGAGTTLTVFTPGASTGHQVELGCDGPNELFVDGESELVVVCSGRTVFGDPDAPENSNAQVVFLDPETEIVTERLRLDVQIGSANGSQSAYYAPAAEEVYAISNGNARVFRIDTDADAFDGSLTVPASDSFTGLSAVAYDGADERLYLARLAVGSGGGPDFQARGQVVILDDDGETMGGFRAGIAPSHITLRR